MTKSNSPTTIITGGASGIGAATAKRLARSGAHLILAGRDGERGARFAHELKGKGGDVRFIRTDVRKEAEVASLIAETLELHGRIDAVFNNAGVEGTVGPMAAWSEIDVSETIDTNLKGAFHIMKHASRPMVESKRGIIVNCASVLGLVPVPIAGIYAATKAALLHLTRCAAAELAEHGVQVVAVCPTVVNTPMMDRVSSLAGAPKTALAEMVCPTGQLGEASTVGEHVFRLLTGETTLEPGEAMVVTQLGTHAVQPAAFAP